MTTTKKIQIAGSGPAGLTAAITLAKAGFDVHVFERNDDVGMRFDGDLQGLENWSEKIDVMDDLVRMNIVPTFDYTPFRQILVSNTRQSTIVKSRQPLFYLVKRGMMPGSLDQVLKEQAITAGVQFHFRTDCPIERADIIATGPRLNQVVGIVKGIVFQTGLQDTAMVVANDQTGRLGYAYLLVTKGYGCLCAVQMERGGEVSASYAAAETYFRQTVALDIHQPRGVGGVGSFSLHPRWQVGHQCFVGEAAGIQDLLGGFNIRNAITSGWLAATSLIENTSYTRLAQTKLLARMKVSAVNRYWWELASRHQYRSVISLLRIFPNPRRLLGLIYQGTLLHNLAYARARHHLRRRYPKLSW